MKKLIANAKLLTDTYLLCDMINNFVDFTDDIMVELSEDSSLDYYDEAKRALRWLHKILVNSNSELKIAIEEEDLSQIAEICQNIIALSVKIPWNTISDVNDEIEEQFFSLIMAPCRFLKNHI